MKQNLTIISLCCQSRCISQTLACNRAVVTVNKNKDSCKHTDNKTQRWFNYRTDHVNLIEKCIFTFHDSSQQERN